MTPWPRECSPKRVSGCWQNFSIDRCFGWEMVWFGGNVVDKIDDRNRHPPMLGWGWKSVSIKTTISAYRPTLGRGMINFGNNVTSTMERAERAVLLKFRPCRCRFFFFVHARDIVDANSVAWYIHTYAMYLADADLVFLFRPWPCWCNTFSSCRLFFLVRTIRSLQ